MDNPTDQAARASLAERISACIDVADALSLPLVAAHLDTALTALALPKTSARNSPMDPGAALH